MNLPTDKCKTNTQLQQKPLNVIHERLLDFLFASRICGT
jgi:hypothetical protein